MTLRLAATAAVVGPRPGRAPEIDADALRYQRDLHAPFGVPIDEDLFRSGPGVTYTDLVELLVGELGAEAPKPELVLLAYGLPDVHPFKAVASHLNHLLGDGAQSFAVSEQGLGSPFTALEIAAAYECTDGVRSSVLAVVEQTTLPARDPVAARVTVDSGVLLVFGHDTGLGELVAVRRLGETGQVAGLVAALEPAGRPLVVRGPFASETQRPVPGADYHDVPAGSFCTSVWLALAQHARTWLRRYETVVLVDTDPRTGDSFAAVLRGVPPRRTCDGARLRTSPESRGQ